MAPPYPTTARGLLTRLEADAEAFPAYLAALVDLEKRLPVPIDYGNAALPPELWASNGTKPKPKPRKQVRPFTGAAEAYRITRRLIDDVFYQLPGVLAALRVIVHGGGDVAPVAAPLYEAIPDPNTDAGDVSIAAGAGWHPDRAQWFRDIGTGAVTYLPGQWPEPLVDLHSETLPECARTLQLLRSRDAGYHELARQSRGGNRPARQSARQAIRAAAGNYRDAVALVEATADPLAEQFSARVHTLTSALAALLTNSKDDLTMPTLTAATAVINDLATRIRAAIDSGHGGRLVVSDAEQAFAWAPGPAVTLLSFLAQGTVTGRRTTVVTASDAVNVVGPVAEGGLKKTVVDFDSADVNLVKYPGQATLTVEAAQFVANIETAVATVISGQIVRAIEADAATAIDGAAGIDIAGAATMTGGVLAAIAAIRGNGGAPNVVGLSAEDWIAIMEATGAGGYLNFSNPEAGPAGTWLGLAPVIVPGLTEGNAIVADGRSVTVSEPQGGPLCIVDPFTQAANNKIVITVEEWAVSAVTSPGGVATVAVTPTP